MALKAYDLTTGNQVHIGDSVVSFRGDLGILTKLERGESPGRSGKVAVEVSTAAPQVQAWSGTYTSHNYDNVWNLRVVEETEVTS